MNTVFRRWLGGAALFAFSLNLSAHAGDMSWVNGQLKKFMNGQAKSYSSNHEFVAKHDPDTDILLYDPKTGEPALDPVKKTPLIHPVPFSKQRIQSRDFIFDKDKVGEKDKKRNGREETAKRNKHRKQQQKARAAIRGNDLPEDLVEKLEYKRLDQMDKLMSAKVKVQPWSDDYWAIYKGIIAARYVAEDYPQDWSLLADYFEKNQSNMDDLSPAEKYDLIVGDKDENGNLRWNLKEAMLAEGKEYYNPNKNPTVETWMGICHGWTPASIRINRPAHSIQALTASGEKIVLYPSDIKALESLLWANGKFEQRFISGRCDEKNPAVDETNGRILSQNCFDTNPGTWHQVVVNQIGALGESFILDATWDYEVWNQPAYSYEYIYFNPKSGEQVDTLEAARVPTDKMIEDEKGKHATFEGDQFAHYRSPDAKYIVGIAMRFVYIAETVPSHNTPDDPRYDRKVAVNYLYDLETKEDMTIIGGEWYHHEHPDFLWMPAPGVKAQSIGDVNLTEEWDGLGKVPDSYTEAASYAASEKNQPLAAIVHTLALRSHLGQ